ncbi:MAG: NlpC/P60 family protein [Fusobacterium varium]|uniref:NlpC/P60 family protein n=1 Tax=Fusobacterium varium TaxID=856 RepID=UPI00242E44D6|nr:NlpC/P60 family protein [Fusobacterium varium]UYI77614.1 MAG: NlpC/P60 family protein [Fusobacterium varium]
MQNKKELEAIKEILLEIMTELNLNPIELMKKAYTLAGIKRPDYSNLKYYKAENSLDNIRPGDLLFFDTKDKIQVGKICLFRIKTCFLKRLGINKDIYIMGKLEVKYMDNGEKYEVIKENNVGQYFEYDPDCYIPVGVLAKVITDVQ